MVFKFAALIALGAILAAAETPGGPARIRIPRVRRAPQLADFIEGRAREAEAAITDFRQREPKDGEPASRATAAYLSYDDKHLYAAFVCTEDPARVRAHVSRREAVAGDDLVGIALDTFHDGHRAYVFYSNAYGVQADGLATEGQRDDYTFDAVWRSEGRITRDGYVVLIAIPFRSIRFSEDPNRSWGIALTRHIPETSEAATWPHLSSKIDAYIPQFATLERMDNVVPGRNMQVVPYGFLSANRFLDESKPGALQNRTELRGGVDAKATFRNGLTLDLTANPDFSQVESDEPQVTVNQRYEVAFPERRPFFQDNSGFFQTPEPLFFSRRIIDPQFGAKLTGKIGNWGIGALVMDDRAPGEIAAPGDPEFGARALDGVVRIRRDLQDGSSAGFMSTVRQFGTTSNSVFSADTRWKLTPNWIFTGQFMASGSRNGSEASSGAASFAEIRHAGRHFNYYTNYRWRSPEFAADLGYFPRVDVRQLKNVAGYRWRPETGPLLSFGPALFTLVNYDHTGRLQDWSVNMPFFIDLKGPISIATDTGQSYEYWANRGFRKSYNQIWVSVERWKRVSVTGSFTRGVGINYFPAAGVTPFTGSTRDAQMMLTVRPSARLRIDESFIYSSLARGASPVYTDRLFRSKVNYQFTRGLSFRAIVDYGSVFADARLIDLDARKRLRSDVLATYMVNPWTAIYAGYGDIHENLQLDDVLARTGRASLLTGRQVFVKFSYLIRF